MTPFAASKFFGRMGRNAMLAVSSVFFVSFVILLVVSCSRSDNADSGKGRVRALRMQQLRNLTPGEDVLPEMRLIVDSMRRDGKDVYYFAAMNVLIDQLFSRDLIGEADSMATQMIREAQSDDNRLALATAYRVKGQILFKVGRMDSVLQEFGRGRALIADKPTGLDEFSTAAAIDEWIWMAAREIGDTAAMRKAGLRYADEVRSQLAAGWTDSTRHFEVTALAFRAADKLGSNDNQGARMLLDSASRLRLPSLPVRAYEHWYAVRSDLDAAQGDYASAMALLDTIEEAHRYFPWFRLHDLHHKAELAAKFGTPAQVAKAYGDYISLNDSLYAIHNEARFRDLTVLYHTELERGHRKLTIILTTTLSAILLLLAVLLAISMRNAQRERRKNSLLVERLQQLDKLDDAATVKPVSDVSDATPLDRLDRHMVTEKPYTDPALSRRELAAAVGVSQEEVTRIIREGRDMTVLAYINHHRLEAARHMLGSDETMPIAEMAHVLGFGTARTLQRAFKAKYDMTPTQYRELSRHDA